MTQRIGLARKWESGLYSVTELAEEFGVSRPTVYEWTARYMAEGEAGLVDRLSIPKSCPHRTASEIVERLVEAKQQRPHWGPDKLIDLLREENPDIEWPAVSTAGRILERRGLVKKRKKRRISPMYQRAGQLKASESGEMMTADHKGQFRLGSGQYVYPVTINDPVSRFVYAVDAVDSTSFERAKPSFERVFKDHGIPYFLGSDNGGPFCCSRALGGLSRLSVWWIKLGITPVRIHKGCPWENGVHERMHRTLKAETSRPPAETMKGQQKKFDVFREEFNNIRSHQGLNGQRPAKLVRPCRRSWPSQVPNPDYPAHYETRRVQHVGTISWDGHDVFVSECLAGERIGFEETEDGIWNVHFAAVELGRFNEKTKTIS